MNRIPTIEERAQELGYTKKVAAYKAARKEVDEVRQKLQDDVLGYLYDNFSIDPLLWFFSPEEPYFRMSDHNERGMPSQDYIRLQMDHTKENRPLKNIKVGSHVPTVCRDIDTLADTLQHQAYLIQALRDPVAQNLIASAYCEIRKKLDESKPHQEYREAKRDMDYFEKTAAWSATIELSGINTPEAFDEWLETMNPGQLKEIASLMGIGALVFSLNQPEKIKKVIAYYFCVPNNHYNS